MHICISCSRFVLPGKTKVGAKFFIWGVPKGAKNPEERKNCGKIFKFLLLSMKIHQPISKSVATYIIWLVIIYIIINWKTWGNKTIYYLFHMASVLISPFAEFKVKFNFPQAIASNFLKYWFVFFQSI